uniref:DUF4116 domain-containing protein n=1 Tax=Megaviridae environmental sample TaxID=1737588 RepID=A0A5J6VJQ9_9VIRU|nr:MAG: protein of unknown function DUF4116 [Megaviridae environmental sample]
MSNHLFLQLNKNEAISVVSKDGFKIKKLNHNLQKDKDVIIAAITSDNNPYPFNKLDDYMKHDKDVVLASVYYLDTSDPNFYPFESINEKLRGDKDIALHAVTLRGGRLAFLSKELQGNKTIVMAAVSNAGNSIWFASENLRDDKDVVMRALSNRKEHNHWYKILEVVSKRLRNDREVAFLAADDEDELAYVSEELRDDKKFILGVYSKFNDYRKLLVLKYASPRLQKELSSYYNKSRFMTEKKNPYTRDTYDMYDSGGIEEPYDDIPNNINPDNIPNNINPDNYYVKTVLPPTRNTSCSKRNIYEITKEEEQILLNFDKKRILLPYSTNPDKKRYYQKVSNSLYIPKRTLNSELGDNKSCSYCKRIYKECITPHKTPAYLTGFEGGNCPSVNKEQKEEGIKCTKGNAYTLVIPSYHISIPMTNDWLDLRKRANKYDTNYIFGGMPQEILKIMSKIMFHMYFMMMDWGNDVLAYKKYSGVLDKFYEPKVGKNDYTGKYYDTNAVNNKASEGGSEIGTMFPFFHYPTGIHHAHGRLWEHLHLQVPLRCTDDGYSHLDFKKYENTKKWDKGLKFMENNITGETENISGDSSGKSFHYTYNKMISSIKDTDIPKTLDYNENDLIIDFDEEMYDLKNIKFNESFLDNLELKYDKKTDLYLYTLPKGTLLYRGFHSGGESKLNCAMMKTNSDPTNNFREYYTWYSNLNTAISYAIRINMKRFYKDIPNFNFLYKTNKDELYKLILSSAHQLGIVKVYKTQRELQFVDLINSKNLEVLLKEYDRLNIIKKDNRIQQYINYTTYPQNVIRNDKIAKTNLSNPVTKDIEKVRSDLMYVTGFAVNIHEQINNIHTDRKKKVALKRYFSLIDENSELSTDKILYTRYRLKNDTIISHLLKDCNRFSSMKDDSNMVKLLEELFKKNYNHDDTYGLNKYKNINGYIGVSTPSLGTTAGYFHPELCIFSNIDEFGTPMIDDDIDNIDNSCHPNSNINKTINALAVYLFTNKFQLNCKWDYKHLENIDDDEILQECNNIIKKIDENSVEIRDYNKNVSRCPSLVLTNDNF